MNGLIDERVVIRMVDSEEDVIGGDMMVVNSSGDFASVVSDVNLLSFVETGDGDGLKSRANELDGFVIDG